MELIHSYISNVNQFIDTVKFEYNVDNILIAKRARLIPAQGTTKDGRFTFRFHGIGCEVQGPDFTIDFDFGESAKVGGFDSWRLAHFAETYKRCEGHGFTEERIRVDLEKLVAEGMVVAPRSEPSPHLLYLAECKEV
jgi:hypothetical protein